MTNYYWNLSNDLSDFDLWGSDAHPMTWNGVDALYFENKSGLPVLLKNDLKLDCFRLQAEVAVPGPNGFVGLIFGAVDSQNYELVYISPDGESYSGEIQYDPIMNGSSTWQIYHGPDYQSPVQFPPGEWTQLTLDVQPHAVSISVGQTVSPQLVIQNLQHQHSAGRIGVWSYLPSYIRNLTVTKIHPTPIERKLPDLNQLAADSFVTNWSVSKPYWQDHQPEPEHQWVKTSVDENGTLNLNRLYPSTKDTSVQTKCEFYLSDEKETVLTCSFSDRLRLWVNEEEVFHGQWKWNPPGEDGRIRSDHAAVPVHWKAGLNTSRAEITSEEVMFGWGLSVKTGLPDLSC